MILVEGRNEAITLAPDPESVPVLNSPLHKIYLRGTLNARRRGEQWHIPINDVETLKRIAAHLSKYGIGYELDSFCSSLLAAYEERKDQFHRSLERAKSLIDDPPEIELARLADALQDGFVRQLTDYQLKAVLHLCTINRGANFSVPGSGKTTVILAFLHQLRAKGLAQRLLVIGPASSFVPWEEEYQACFGGRPQVLRLAGYPRDSRIENYRRALGGSFDLLLTTFHSAVRDVAELEFVVRSQEYLVVLDESHYIKRFKGGVLAEAAIRVGRRARFKAILSGTPLPNGIEDLWSQFAFLFGDDNPLGTTEQFESLCDQVEPRGEIEVRRRIAGTFTRTTKRQLRLPKFDIRPLALPMSPLQSRIYDGIVARFLSLVSETPKDREALRQWRRARTVRLLQVASNPGLLNRRCDEFNLTPLNASGVSLKEILSRYPDFEVPPKIRESIRLARELASQGRKVIIWSTFVHNLKMLSGLGKELNPVVIHGGIPVRSVDSEEFDRESLIREFRSNPQCMLMLANPAACAESISLHRECHNAIYLDRDFNCGRYLQSMDRIHRIGLGPKTITTYYILSCLRTVDEVVNQRLEEKRETMERILEAPFPSPDGVLSLDVDGMVDTDFERVEEHIQAFVRQ